MTVIHRVTAIYRVVIYRFDCIPIIVYVGQTKELVARLM